MNMVAGTRRQAFEAAREPDAAADAILDHEAQARVEMAHAEDAAERAVP